MYIWSEFEDFDFYFCPPLEAVCPVTFSAVLKPHQIIWIPQTYKLI